MAKPEPNTAKNTPDNPQQLGQVVDQVKGWVDRLGWVWVTAQVIELRRRAAAMQFLTLRDLTTERSATVTCTTTILDSAGPVTEGMTVVALLTPTVWEKSSRLSFQCADLRIAGEGKLLAAIEALKQKLRAEGLFDPIRKKSLPFLPSKIGLITGSGSAAERDVLTNIARRWPGADVTVRNTLVQGPQAAAQVIQALQDLDADPEIKVIVIARGGGSLEDLLPFSDEGMVRAVAAAKTPIVSAIGHEPDNPLIDFAADVRASTPTKAAELVVPDVGAERTGLATVLNRMRQHIIAMVRAEQSWLDSMKSRPALKDPLANIVVHNTWLADQNTRMLRAIQQQVTLEQREIEHALRTVRSMSPKATLERGYAIVADAEGGSISSTHDVEPGDQIQVYLADGHFYAEVDYQEDDE